VEGTAPTIFDNIYQEFQINRETGRLATIYTPSNLIDTIAFRIYPEKAADWVRENELEQPPTEFDTITGPIQRAGDVTILSPAPFDYVSGRVAIQGSTRVEDFDHYRLAYFPGLTPIGLEIIADNVPTAREETELGEWDVTNLNGLYTLLLTVVRTDGSFEEVSIPVTVDNQPPEVEILFPLPGQTIFTDEEWVIIQALAEDELSLDRVEFFVDNAGVPFAVSTVPPFSEKWTVPGPGCHAFHVVAVDAAGNESTSSSVNVCLVERDN
jgi:hypothetical protein